MRSIHRNQKDQQIEAFLNKLEDLGYKSSWRYRGKSNSDKNAFADTGSTIVEE